MAWGRDRIVTWLVSSVRTARASTGCDDLGVPMTDSTDEAGFTAFVVEVERPLQRTAYLLTGDHGHAADLVQTTLVKAHRHWPRVREADSPLAYVRRVLVTTHVSWRRRMSTSEQVIETVPGRPGLGTGEPLTIADVSDLDAAVITCLAAAVASAGE